MYCNQCGKEVSEEDMYCNSCGNKLKDEIAGANSASRTSVKSENSNCVIWLGILCGIFLNVFGVIIGLIVFRNEKASRKLFLKCWGITFGVLIGIEMLFGMFEAIFGGIYIEPLSGLIEKLF